jgi:hypothetical protein
MKRELAKLTEKAGRVDLSEDAMTAKGIGS